MIPVCFPRTWQLRACKQFVVTAFRLHANGVVISCIISDPANLELLRVIIVN